MIGIANLAWLGAPAWLRALHAVNTAAGALAVAGTLVSFHRSEHWSVRCWVFPRLQIAIVAAVSAALHVLLFNGRGPADAVFLLGLAATVLWQGWKIFPYTPLSAVQVEM